MEPGIVRFKGRRDSQGTSRRSSGGQARINVGRLAAAPSAGSIVREAKRRGARKNLRSRDTSIADGCRRAVLITSSGRPCLAKRSLTASPGSAWRVVSWSAARRRSWRRIAGAKLSMTLALPAREGGGLALGGGASASGAGPASPRDAWSGIARRRSVERAIGGTRRGPGADQPVRAQPSRARRSPRPHGSCSATLRPAVAAQASARESVALPAPPFCAITETVFTETGGPGVDPGASEPSCRLSGLSAFRLVEMWGCQHAGSLLPAPRPG